MKNQTLKVLLVDDDQEDYMIIRDLISDIDESSFELDWVSTFEEAKDKISSSSHDVYLVDNRLGSQSGLDLITDRNGRVPIILLTGQSDRSVDMEAMKRGAQDYLVKNQLTAPLLERALRYAVNRMHIMSELREREESIRRLYDERISMEAQILQQDRLASIGLLASSLAHEIGTPLGVMRGRAELITMHPDIESTGRNAQIILDQIDRVSKLIRALLNLARGEGSATVSAISASTVLIDVLDLIGHEFARKEIELVNELDPRTSVLGEAGPLHQVFLNLLVNAMHAIEEKNEGGRRIRITSKSTPNEVVIAISDTGCGISSGNLKQIFKPFFTTKDIGKGTGLGLATSFRIIGSWGGRITVDSEEGIGSTFSLHFQPGAKAAQKSDMNRETIEGRPL